MLFNVQSWLIRILDGASDQAAIILIRKRSSFARSYMERLISFRRVICPSVRAVQFCPSGRRARAKRVLPELKERRKSLPMQENM
jgi:hypothetical protein